MAYDSLKALIRQYIKTNGEQEITGQILQNVLVEMVNQYPSTDGYATQSWVTSQGYATTSQLAGYLPLTGGNLDGNLSIYDTMNIYSSSIEWNDDGDYSRIAFDDDGITVTAHGTGYVIANEFVKSGGTSAQFLKADGSVDSNTYITSASLSGYATQSWVNTQLGGYLPLTGGNLNGNLSIYDTMNIYSSSIEWNDSGDYCRIAFDQDGITVTAHGTGYVIANEFIKNGGTSAQFLKADGSVDSNTYLTSASLAGYATQSWVQQQGYLTSSALSGYATQSWVTTQLGNYLPLTGGNLDGNLSIYDTMNIYSSSIEWNDSGDYCRIAFDDDGITVTAHGTGYVTANEFIKSGGTSAQFLKADGSVDSTAYITLASVKGNLSAWNNTAMTWGTLTAANGYTIGVHASSSDGGDWGMAYKGGQIFMQLDGYYYQNEGAYRVVDTSDLASYNPTTNFKTINNQSIIGTGNINIQGGGGAYYDSEVEYLESTGGGQYIDTGWVASYSDGFVIETEYEFSSAGNRGCLLSNYDSGQTSLSLETISGPRFYFYQGRLDYEYAVSAGVKHTTIFSYVNNVYSLTVDGIIRHSVTASYTGGSNYSSYMFLDRNMRTDTFNKNLKIYRLKIKSGNNVVRDFIPVRIGNVGYMYDKVSGQLFGNSGTGDFVLGQDTGPGGGLPYLPLTGGTITGNLTINSGSDNTYLKIYGSSANGYGQIYVDGDGLNISGYYAGGNLYLSGNVTVTDDLDVFSYLRVSSDAYARSFIQTSDLRKKTITGDVPMNIYNVANAPLFKFTWKDEKEYSGQHIGSAAQYWQTVLPELVSIGRDADMTLAMQYDVIALASAITVAKTVVNHEERIILLERENEALKKEIADLKSA